MRTLGDLRSQQLLLPLSLSFVCGTFFGAFFWNTSCSTLWNLWASTLRRLQGEVCEESSAPFNNNDERCDVPENAPEDCPGLESKASACAGCPNQEICASGAAKEKDPSLTEIARNMANIKKKILVLSGKGGVGKSTVSSQLSWMLQERGFDVGVLDIDVCGPSIPMMTGSRGMDVHASADGWSPVYVESNLAVMSVGFLLPEENDAVIWRGPKKNGLIKQFLTDVSWGNLDILIVDTPPGTSDEHLSIVTYLKEAGIDGALIVSTPQEVALQDVRKEINFCKKVEIPILGLVENMTNSVFDGPRTAATTAAQETCIRMAVPYAGSVPMDRDLLLACESGISVSKINPFAAALPSLNDLVNKVLSSVGLPSKPDTVQDHDEKTVAFQPIIAAAPLLPPQPLV